MSQSNTNKTKLNGIVGVNNEQRVHPAWIAGYTSGIAGLVVGHPLDSLKVWLQTNNKTFGMCDDQGKIIISSLRKRNLPPMKPSSSLHNLQPTNINFIQKRHLFTSDFAKSAQRHFTHKAIALASHTKSSSSTPMKNYSDLIRKMYRGMSTPMVTVGTIQAINFALYEEFKHLSNNNIALSSFLSGAIVSTITAPLVAIKLKQQLLNMSWTDAVKDLRSKGTLYKGFSAHFLCESLGRSIFFTSYEYIKQSSEESTREQTIYNRVSSAMIAGLISSTILYPCDVVRSKMQANSYNHVMETITYLYKNNGGFKAFTRGYGVMVLRSGPVAAISMPVYDMTMDAILKRQ